MQSQINLGRLTWRLKLDEGFTERAFWDSAEGSTHGQWTNGYGTRAKYPYEKITEQEAEKRLMIGIGYCHKTFLRVYHHIQNSLNSVRSEALINMLYNLGCGGVMSFKNMNASLSMQPIDWEAVGAHAADSRWRVQVGRRADRLIQELITGEYYFGDEDILRIKV